VTRYSVGDQVLIRFGRHQGQKGTILKRQPAEVYEVKGEDGAVLFFSGEGLERVKGQVLHHAWPARSGQVTIDREREPVLTADAPGSVLVLTRDAGIQEKSWRR